VRMLPCAAESKAPKLVDSNSVDSSLSSQGLLEYRSCEEALGADDDASP
jgi:hypothetical protein